MTYNQMVAPLKEYIPNIDTLLWGDTDRPIIMYETLGGDKYDTWLPLYTAFIEAGFNKHSWN